MKKNKVILDNLVVVFSMLLWALGLPILDLQQEGWDGFSLSSARALLAGLTMLGLAYFSRPVFFRRKEVLTSFFLGIFGYGLMSLLLVIGIGYAGAVTAAIIAALVPVISALLDVIATRRMIDFRLFIAVILSLVGGLIATLNDQEMVLTLGWGELLLLSSVVLWVLYSRFSLSMLGQAHPVGGYGLTMIAGSVGLLLATFIAGFFGYELKQDFSFDSVMVVLFLGIFSTGLSVLLWLHGAKRLGVTTAGLHQNLVPAFVMLIMFILGEGFQWREGVGGLLVISGAIIAQLRKREST